MSISAAQAFVERWDRSTVNEKGTAQQHFIDLCRLLGIPTPAEVDPHGMWYRFEKPLKKEGGGAGFADVWRAETFALEYKSKGRYATLADALTQLKLYKKDLGNPPVLIVSDIARYELYISSNDSVERVEKFSNADLLSSQTRELLYAALTNPQQLIPRDKTVTVTERVAAKFAQVAQLVEKRGHDPHDVAHFFMKLLFAMFCEDIGLLPNNLFSQTLKAAVFNPDEFNNMIRPLFGQMRTGGYWGPGNPIPYFNGGLFADDFAIPLKVDDVQFLYDAARQDWRDVEPAIFGTLFERSLDPNKRSQLGAHYTSRDDILLLVEPVLMQPLRREWDTITARIEGLRPQYEAATGVRRAQLKNTILGLLLEMSERLSTITVLDPACGSGNFLYVALQQLKDLEREVITYGIAIGVATGDDEIRQAVSPRQLYGIEKNPFAAELAQVVVWIGDLQWNVKHGFPNDRRPVLETLDTIRCADAILEYDLETGQPVEPQWPAAEVIVGNPPFLGGNRIRKELGDQTVDTLFKLYEDRIPAFADLVTYWFEKARAQIERGNAKRAGLIATNSIRGGANRKVLQRIKHTGDIFYAWADRPWVLDGAAVRVSMIGFDGGDVPADDIGAGSSRPADVDDLHDAEGARTAPLRMLDGQPVAAINADLTGAVDVTTARPLPENFGIAFMGPSPKAPFDIDKDVAQRLLAAPLNINGRSNSDVVRPVASAVDLVQRSRNKWTIDFGMMPYDQAAEYEAPFEYVKQNVLPVRQTRRDDYQGQWWRYARPRPEMREALKGKQRFVATPAVAKHRVFVWMPVQVLCNQGTLVFARDDDYFFGVLHSRLHELWSLRMGTFLGVGNDPRYTPTTTFETFPFPWPPGTEPHGDPRVEAIAAAARELVRRRDLWLDPPTLEDLTPVADGNHPSPIATSEGSVERADDGRFLLPDLPLTNRTLTNLYNRRPDWLAAAHATLDKAVLDAYGWPDDLPDDEILARLLALNGERAG